MTSRYDYQPFCYITVKRLQSTSRYLFSKSFSVVQATSQLYRIPSAFILSVALFLGFTSDAVSQVNIEKMRVEDPEGLSFTFTSNFAIRAGNLKRYDVSVGSRLDYKIERNHIFLLGNVGYGESRNQSYKNRSFAHLRFMHIVSPLVTTELFGQVENDEFTLLQIRILAGIGVRMPYVKREHVAISQGMSFMFEHEELDPVRVVLHPSSITSNRWNNYVNIRLQLNDSVSFFNTGYFQPRFDDFNDFRLLLDSGLQIEFSSRFSFYTSLNLRYDSRPPDELESLDLDVQNGFRLQF